MKGLIAELETMESPKRALNMDKKALNVDIIWNMDKKESLEFVEYGNIETRESQESLEYRILNMEYREPRI